MKENLTQILMNEAIHELIRLPGNDLKTVRPRYLSFPCTLASVRLSSFSLISH